MISDIRNFENQLLWKADMHIINDFNEHVWLKDCFLNGKLIGITDCCMFDNPCDWHKKLQKYSVILDIAKRSTLN